MGKKGRTFGYLIIEEGYLLTNSYNDAVVEYRASITKNQRYVHCDSHQLSLAIWVKRIVCVVLTVVSFANHRPCLKRCIVCHPLWSSDNLNKWGQAPSVPESWLTWCFLADFGFDLLYDSSKGTKRHCEHMSTVSGNLTQLRSLVSTSNTKNKNFTANGLKASCWLPYAISGHTICHKHCDFLAACHSSPTDNKKNNLLHIPNRLVERN